MAGPSSITIHTNTRGLPNCNSAAYISPLQMARHCSLLKRLSHSRFIGSCVLGGVFLGRLLIDISAAMSVEIRSSIVRLSIMSRSIYRPSGVSCRSTDRPTVSRDSISSVSAMYRWMVDRVLVRYRWCISIEKMSQHSSFLFRYEAAGQNWFRFILFWPVELQSWND